MTHKKNKTHKKCGAKVGSSNTPCRHTAKSNGRCQAHSNLAIAAKIKKEAEKKAAKHSKSPIKKILKPQSSVKKEVSLPDLDK